MALTKHEWADAIKVAQGYVETYLRVIEGGKALNAKQAAALIADMKNLKDNLAGFAAALEEDPAPSFTAPSMDTLGLLNQWLAARDDPSSVPGGSLFSRNGDGDIVQLVANIVGSGTAYGYEPGDISPETLALAQSLNRDNRFAITPVYLASLNSGEPGYARSIGVASDSIVA